MGCTKYYGEALRLDENGTLVVHRAPPVGEMVSCKQDNDQVYAWEFNLAAGASMEDWILGRFKVRTRCVALSHVRVPSPCHAMP